MEDKKYHLCGPFHHDRSFQEQPAEKVKSFAAKGHFNQNFVRLQMGYTGIPWYTTPTPGLGFGHQLMMTHQAQAMAQQRIVFPQVAAATKGLEGEMGIC